MQAAAAVAPGGPEVLTTIEIDEPTAAPGQVRIKVRTAGVQPIDLTIRQGRTPPGMTVQYPQVLGNEFAGTVDQVGADVTGFAVGDAVLGFQTLGCYAQYVVVGGDQIVAKPPGMTWEIAGGLPGAGQTAHTAIEELGVRAGDTLLVHGAAGAVGTVAVQLARLAGAAVIGTASEPNHEYLRSLGVVPVTYGDGLAERVRQLAPQGVDVSLDAAGPDALRAAVELVADRRRIATIVAFELAPQLGVRFLRSQRSAARLVQLVRLVDEGSVRIHLRGTYPLERAADAHRELATGHGRGKVVLAAG
jgi:NADPH:quinone reductase-like Zn-dependent oxidoreductase